MNKKAFGVLAFIGVMSPAWSAVTFSGSNLANTLSAQATFDVIGSNLVVILTNTSTTDVLVPADVLTAVFFDYSGSALTLTRTSALLTSGSTVLFGSAPGGVVGGEWGYKGGLVGAPNGSLYGISSSGFGLYGPTDVFPGGNLQGPVDPDGLQYGITSASDNPLTGNAKVTGSQALIKNSVTFTLAGVPQGFNLDMLRNVSFQYGTELTEPNITGKKPSGEPTVPGPAAIIPFGLGLAAALRRKRS